MLRPSPLKAIKEKQPWEHAHHFGNVQLGLQLCRPRFGYGSSSLRGDLWVTCANEGRGSQKKKKERKKELALSLLGPSLLSKFAYKYQLQLYAPWQSANFLLHAQPSPRGRQLLSDRCKGSKRTWWETVAESKIERDVHICMCMD